VCTVSVIRPSRRSGTTGPHWRLVCNRDEQRTRPIALPPTVGTIGRFRAISPIDPQGPGTWVAATSAGLAFALLNGRSAHVTGASTSRGRIIPLIAGASDLPDALARLERLQPLATQPFSLLVAGDAGVLQVDWDGSALVSRGVTTGPRMMHTSSSLDPDKVGAARAETFRRCVEAGVAWTQDAFHRSIDKLRPARGVLMTRPDACTVSITTIDMFRSHVRLAYRPVRADLPGVDRRYGRQPAPLMETESAAVVEVARAR
jgi:hypothetical protein